MREMKGNIQRQTELYNLCFGHPKQWCSNLNPIALHACFCSCTKCCFDSLNKFQPAVGIAGVVDHVRTEIDDRSSQHFSMCRSQRQKNQVSTRHVGNGHIPVPLRFSPM